MLSISNQCKFIFNSLLQKTKLYSFFLFASLCIDAPNIPVITFTPGNDYILARVTIQNFISSHALGIFFKNDLGTSGNSRYPSGRSAMC
jgi:hypothetical protein